jgi:hypothetical protein
MWIDNESQDAAQLFWHLAGEVENYPRTLERAVSLALPIALVKLPHLGLLSIERWLRMRQITNFTFHCQNRRVRGCLVAFCGKGLVFVDGTDPVDELRFSIAHEVAHFLLDFWLPRQNAQQNLGPAILEVMDGIRPPDVNERVYALLNNIKIGLQTNLLERNSESGEDALFTWKAEDRADKLALALLAPPEAVLANCDLTGATFPARHESVINCLVTSFGLPASVAPGYSLELLHQIGKGPSWTESLRFR